MQSNAHTSLLIIDSFKGNYSFLSNDFPAPVYWDGRIFPCASYALFVAQYDLSAEHIEELQRPRNTSEATVNDLMPSISNTSEVERPDWVQHRRIALFSIIRDKFIRTPDLATFLLDTEGRQLVWRNKKDNVLGVVGAEGENLLGEVLMTIRDDLKKDAFSTWLKSVMGAQVQSQMKPNVTLTEMKHGDSSFVPVKHCLNVNKLYWSFGTLPESDIVAENPSVSRRHAVLYVNIAGILMMMDVRSKSGTYLNNTRIATDHVPYAVSPGSVIRLGMSTRIYQVQIDKEELIRRLHETKQKLHAEIQDLHTAVTDPGGTGRQEVKVCVKNLSFHTSKTDLIDFFEICGEIKNIILPQPRKATESSFQTDLASRGIAFIEFETPQGARNAIKKHESFLNKRKLQISYVQNQEARGDHEHSNHWRRGENLPSSRPHKSCGQPPLRRHERHDADDSRRKERNSSTERRRVSHRNRRSRSRSNSNVDVHRR